MKGRIPTFPKENRLVPVKLKSFHEYEVWSQDSAVERETQKQIELSLSPLQPRTFSIRGTCALCGVETMFRANFDYPNKAEDGRLIPNFRECLTCAHCGLKNRLRGVLHLFVQEFGPEAAQPIYITEQLGAAYRWLKGRFPAVSGSEFIPKSGPFGTSPRGIRNEDLCALTWPGESFDFILSFDVLEHVADVNAAFSEICRCLRPGGKFLFTAPFRIDLKETLVRATVDSNGNITHCLEPEYHGGNLSDSSKGTLCLRHFGWDTIQQLEKAGFSDAEVWLFWSRELGYIGGTQIAIAAYKKPDV